MSYFLKFLRWLFWLLLILLLAIYGLLGTNYGYRHLPALVSYFTDVELKADIEGNFFGGQRWRNFSLKIPDTVDIAFADLELDWNLWELWDGRLAVNKLRATDGHIGWFYPSEEEEKAAGIAPEPFTELGQVSLPLDIQIGDGQLEKIKLNDNGDHLLDINSLELNGSYNRGRVELRRSFLDTSYGAGSLRGEITTLKDYPANLTYSGSLKLPGLHQKTVQLRLQESLLRPQLRLHTVGDLIGSLQLGGKFDLASDHMSSAISWQNLQYGGYGSSSGQLTAAGKFDRLRLNLATDGRGANLPKDLRLKAAATLAGDRLENLDLALQSLATKVDFSGLLDYSQGLRWQGDLTIDNFQLQDYVPGQSGQLNGKITTSGRQHGDDLQANLEIKRLDGHYERQPISGRGQVSYGEKKLLIQDFFLDWAGNQLQASGHADPERADIKLNFSGGKLHYLLPALAGALQGSLTVKGSLSDPDLSGQFHWQNLRYGPAQRPLLQSRQGQLQASGKWNRLRTQLKAALAGANFPPLTAEASALITPEKATDIRINGQLLKGQVNLTGQVQYKPLRWTVDGRLAQLRPESFYPQVPALINGRLHSEGTINGKQRQIKLLLQELGGNYRGQPLAGGGQINLLQDQLKIPTLQLKLGANQLQLAGDLDGKKLNLRLELLGRQLAALHPQLQGVLNVKGQVQGPLRSPALDLNLQGQNLAFAKNFFVRDISGKLEDQLQRGGKFNNSLTARGLKVAGESIEQVQLTSQGSFDRHQINVQASGKYPLQMQLAGGFKSLSNWQGLLNSFRGQFKGLDFQLDKPSRLNLSPEKISFEELCLHDKFSSFCLDGKQHKGFTLGYRLKKLSPQSFAAFIPKNVKINTSLSGSGQLQLPKNGAPSGTAQLQLTPGSIVVQLEDSAPLVINLQRFTLEAASQGRGLAGKLLLDLGKMGLIQGQLALQGDQVNGQLTANIPDLAVFRNYIPAVSQLKGRVNGTLAFAGPLAGPQVNGQILLSNGAVSIPASATELQNISLRLAAGRSGEIDLNGQVGTPRGNLTARGKLRLSPLQLDLNLEGKNMLVANSKTVKLLITPQFTLNIDPHQGIKVNGTLLIPEARISVPDTSDAVPISEDVVIVDEPKKEAPTTAKTSKLISGNIQIRLGDKVFFDNKDAKIRFIGGLNLILRPGENVRGEGRIEVASGNYSLYGQELDIKKGRLTFSGINIANPTVDFLAMRTVGEVQAGASITGTLKKMQLKLTSKPAMSDSFIISYLIFGKAPDGSMDSAALVEMGANMAIGQFSSNLGEKIHLDVFKLGLDGMKAGKNLSEQLYVGLQSDFLNNLTKFIAQYKFNKRLKMEGAISPTGQSLDFIYEYEKD